MDVPIFRIAEAWTRACWAVSAIRAALAVFDATWPTTRGKFVKHLGHCSELALVDQALQREFRSSLRNQELRLRMLATKLRGRCIEEAVEDMVALLQGQHILETALLGFDRHWIDLTSKLEDMADGPARTRGPTAGEDVMLVVDEQEAPLKTVDTQLATLRSNVRAMMDDLDRYIAALKLVLGTEQGFDAIGVMGITNWSFVVSMADEAPIYRLPTERRVRLRGEPSADGVPDPSTSWIVTDTVQSGQGRLIRISAGKEVLLIGDPEKNYEQALQRDGYRIVDADNPLLRESIISIRRDQC